MSREKADFGKWLVRVALIVLGGTVFSMSADRFWRSEPGAGLITLAGLVVALIGSAGMVCHVISRPR
jgi:hypothetical protein